jgi:hypothetical protein
MKDSREVLDAMEKNSMIGKEVELLLFFKGIRACLALCSEWFSSGRLFVASPAQVADQVRESNRPLPASFRAQSNFLLMDLGCARSWSPGRYSAWTSTERQYCSGPYLAQLLA